jgi:hypothetical protein
MTKNAALPERQWTRPVSRQTPTPMSPATDITMRPYGNVSAGDI